jgi:hypothetical protein
MRASCITTEDLETVAAINRIALNLRIMDKLTKGD